MSVKDYSTTPGSNASKPGINFAEGQVPSSLNDSSRALMADLAEWYAQITAGTISGTVTGFANAIALTTTPAVGGYATNQRFLFRATSANSSATPTLNVSGLGTKTIKRPGGAALSVPAWSSGDFLLVAYDGTDFILLVDTSVASGAQVIAVNSASDALRITQEGAGNALLVEDSANPDSTPFVVKADGAVGIGTTSPSGRLHVTSSGQPVVISADGKLGVGTDSPSDFVTVTQTAAAAVTGLKVTNNSSTSGTRAAFSAFVQTANSYVTFFTEEAGPPYAQIETGNGTTLGLYIVAGTSVTNIPIVFRQGATERLRITSTGRADFNVGDKTPLIFPNYTTAQRNAISSPATGTVIFNTDNNRVEWRTSGGNWQGASFQS